MKCLFSCLSLLWMGLSYSQDTKPTRPPIFNEFHASMNHSLGPGFLGGGVAANHVFYSEKVVSLRTGLELNYFHIWGGSSEPSHYSAVKDMHYAFADLTIPLVMRVNVRPVFFELGGNLGFGIAGLKKGTSITYFDLQPAIETKIKESWSSGFSAGPYFGIGARIPMHEKLDLLIRPDVGANLHFSKNLLNLYGRLCIGIHLK